MTTESITRRPFKLGNVCFTPGVQATIPSDDFLRALLTRHANCDWGDCCAVDWAHNDEATERGNRIFSVYRDRNGVRFWIITEPDRSETNILLPEESCFKRASVGASIE